jgi:internalin A
VSLLDIPEEFRPFVKDNGTRVMLYGPLGPGSSLRGEVPEWLRSLPNINVLNLSGAGLTSLPGWLENLTTLTRLDLNDNNLAELPGSLGNLTALTHLNLSDNQLARVPEWLGNLADLETLDLSGNQLTEVPEWLGSLRTLTHLDLSRNELTELPSSLGNLTNLTKLYLGKIELNEVPEWLGNLTALTTLDLSLYQLQEIPEWLGNLTTLTHLDLSGNELTELPGSLGNLIYLTYLNLSGNRLAAMPEWLGNLTELTKLDLSINRLTKVSERLKNLTSLTELNISTNQLTEVPEWLGNLIDLEVLDLSLNRLSKVPERLGNLTLLIKLDLSNNLLTTLPPQLADLVADVLDLTLAGNPLADPLPELIRRGGNDLATYLRSLHDGITQYEAKLLLVGEGNVGKTSLVAALKDAPFVENRPTTHGIEISPLTFRHPSLNLDMTLRTWDFGGQEVYHVTHQFFLSPRALYIVVWHARRGQEQDEVEAWLRRIQLRVGDDARTLIVATHCKERLPEIDYPHLKQTFPGMLAGSFEIDNRTGDGIENLRKAIRVQAARLPQMGQLISPRWMAAREDVLARAHTDPQIQYEQFVEICEQHNLAGPEIGTLAKLMHDLGLIIYYAEDEGLRDIVVLNPEWLTKAISYVLEDDSTRQGGGVLSHARLREIWQDRRDGYPSRYHRYFLRLMEKFDISYRLEGDELHSLVAQLVPHQRPQLPWQPGTKPATGIRTLTMLCRMSEPAPGLIPWLTVRHHRASTGKHWRRGIFLRHPIDAYASEAILELRSNNELLVEVHAPSPDLYFNVLRDSIEDLITRRWPGMGYQFLVPCPGFTTRGSSCPGNFPLDGLLKIRQGGLTTTVPCMACGLLHEISTLLTGFGMPSQPLSTAIHQIHDQLADIKASIISVQGQAAEIAETVRRVQRVVSAEITDCPHLFTLEKNPQTGLKRGLIHQHHYRLTLWCEHPEHWHPWEPATYELSPSKEWFIKVSQYLTLVFGALKLIVPLAGSIAVASLPHEQMTDAQARLEVMNAVVADLPKDLDRKPEISGITDITSQLSAAEGQGLHALRAILFEHDRLKTFGGMRRVQTSSGDFIWVCPDHYREYDPGLPTVP